MMSERAKPAKQKILAVSSAGGHWSQLMIISEAFKDSDIIYMTTSINPQLNTRPTNSRVIKVWQANLTQKFRIFVLAVQVLVHIIFLRPDLVISTGAAPGFFAVFYGKFLGSKTIWLDSIANYKTLSLSGLKAKPYCDKFLVQWPHLVDDESSYWGNVL